MYYISLKEESINELKLLIFFSRYARIEAFPSKKIAIQNKNRKLKTTYFKHVLLLLTFQWNLGI